MQEASNNVIRARRVALVETSDPYRTVPDCVPLLDAGYDVVVCAGPQSDQLCPALDGLPCPLAREADIVINAVEEPALRTAIARGLRAVAPDIPIAVIAATPGDVINGCTRYPDVEDAARRLCRTGRRRHARPPVLGVVP